MPGDRLRFHKEMEQGFDSLFHAVLNFDNISGANSNSELAGSTPGLAVRTRKRTGPEWLSAFGKFFGYFLSYL